MAMVRLPTIATLTTDTTITIIPTHTIMTMIVTIMPAAAGITIMSTMRRR